MTTNINEASLTELDKMKEAIDNLETAMKKVEFTLNLKIYIYSVLYHFKF